MTESSQKVEQENICGECKMFNGGCKLAPNAIVRPRYLACFRFKMKGFRKNG